MKKAMSICLTVFMAILLVVPVYAAKTDSTANRMVSPQFTYIWSLSAGLSINASGRAYCSGSVDASSNSYTAELTVTLQKSTGSGWTNVQSWTGSGPGQSGLVVEGYYYVGSGTYRVRSTAKIYSPTGKLLETASYYSAERTY